MDLVVYLDPIACIPCCCRSLEELQSYYFGPAQHLVDVMFGAAALGQPDPRYSHLLDGEVRSEIYYQIRV